MARCHEGYLFAKNAQRRRFNQLVFDKLYVVPDGIIGANLAEPSPSL